MKKLIILLTLLALPCFAQSSSITYGWTNSPTLGVTNYNIYWGTSTNGLTNIVQCAQNLQGTVGGLSQGVTYYAAGTAVATNGLGGMAIESIKTPVVSYTIPYATQPMGNFHGLIILP